jgi:hypothetical protein
MKTLRISGKILGLPTGTFVGGLLGVVAGFLETLSAYLIIYAGFLVGRPGWGGPGGAGVAFLLYLSLPAGLLIFIGGALALLRRYISGGIIMLVAGILFPFRVAPVVLWLIFGLPYPVDTSVWQFANLVFYYFFLALPVAGGILTLVFGTKHADGKTSKQVHSLPARPP